MKAVHRPGLAKSYDDPGFDSKPGEFEFVEDRGQRRMWFVCPGCSVIGAIAIRPVVDGSSASWDWDLNVETPTLVPSINHVGCWHGWLTNGQFVSC